MTIALAIFMLGGTAGTAAAAIPGCSGENWQFAVPGQDIANGNSTQAMDSCNARAWAQRLRTEADGLQGCVNFASLVGTLFSFYLSKGTLPQLGAVAGFVFAGSCTSVQIEKRTAAGRISEKVEACGQLGIKFRLFQVDGNPRVIKDFVCQGDKLPPYVEETDPSNDYYIPISYKPTASDIDYVSSDSVLVFFPAQVASPHVDEGTSCSTASHYFSDVRPDEGIAKFWVHETLSGSREQFEYNPETGHYDIYVDTPQLNCPDPLPPSPSPTGPTACPGEPDAAATVALLAAATACVVPDDGQRYQVVTRLESASRPDRAGGLGHLTTYGIPVGATLSVEHTRGDCAANFAYPQDCPGSFYTERDTIMATSGGTALPLAGIGYHADGWPPAVVNEFYYHSWWVEPVP